MPEFQINGRTYNDADTAERHLTALFLDMFADLDIDYGDDAVAWREAFNNWTDMLNKSGDLCARAYNDLCPVGARFDD